MFVKFLRMAVFSCFVTLGFASVASAADCNLRFNSSGSGLVPANTPTVVKGPFTTQCPGGISGSLHFSGTPNVAFTLEKQSGGSWTTVASGQSFTYISTPGTYRYVVTYTSTLTSSFLSWNATFATPL